VLPGADATRVAEKDRKCLGSVGGRWSSCLVGVTVVASGEGDAQGRCGEEARTRKAQSEITVQRESV
jgi:hypothetical protein